MKIAIYHTTDIHGHIFPTNYVNKENLGLLKILSYIDEDREKYDGSLLLDGGDLIQGSVMTNYLSKININNNPILELTKKAKYDAYIMGNHEFNYGLEYLYKSYEPVSDKVLNSNIEGLNFQYKPYRIFNLKGYKIAVIGLTTSYIPNWEEEDIIRDLKFYNPVEIYKKYEKELLDNSDKIVVLYHGGFEKSLDEYFIPTEVLNGENQASEMLEKFDSIDIILSGHQHRSFIRKVKDVICSQPMNNGQNFTKIVLDTETNKSYYELIEVSSLDLNIKNIYSDIFKKLNSDLEKYLSKVIGQVEGDMSINNMFYARLNGHPFTNFLNKLQLELTGADISAVSLFDTAIGFKDKITVRDVLVNYPYSNTLRLIEISGEDLKHALEKTASYFDKEDNQIIINPKYHYPKNRSYIYDIFYGIDYEIDLSRPFKNRVVKIIKDGSEINFNDKFTIALNSYRTINTKEFPFYRNKNIIKEINLDLSEIIINYIQEKKLISADCTRNFKIK